MAKCKTTTLILGLIIVLLLLSGCETSKNPLSQSVVAQSASALTLQDWVNQQTFTPLILWPIPQQSRIFLGPRHIRGSSDYVEIMYSKPMLQQGVEPPVYMIYQSASNLPVGEQFLTDYRTSRSEVVVNNLNVTIDNQPVLLEIRTNKHIPNSGIAIFTFLGTHVAYNWCHMAQKTAIDTLVNNLHPVDGSETRLISTFDTIVASRNRQ
jgi:hypothetical protein